MSKNQNPLRIVADSTKFEVAGGTSNLVANNIYSVEDIVIPKLTGDPTVGDPRLYFSEGTRTSQIKWRKVSQEGWISPKRKAQGDQDTIIQVKFAKPKRFNYISFELLRVPQKWEVRYYDSTRKRMVKLSNLNGKNVEGSISGFRVNTTEPHQTKNDPHKWRRFDYDLPNIRTNLVEIHMNRDIGPEIENLGDFFGLPKNTPYALGLRNLKIKMRVTDDDDVDDGDDGESTPIGTTERAIVKRHTSIMAHDGAETSYWECAPQGAATSVVPFYLDLRQPDGSETTFDVLKLVPIWPGVSMSIYFSSDDNTLPWALSPNRVNLSVVGDTAPTWVRGSGAQVDLTDSGYTISNSYTRMEVGKSWSQGLSWMPTFTNSANDRWLWNWEGSGGRAFGLKFDVTSSGASSMTGQFKVMEDDTTILATLNNSYTLDINTNYSFVVGYNADDLDSSHPHGYYIGFSETPAASSSFSFQYAEGDSPVPFIPTSLRIGTNTDMSRPARGYLSNLWAKQDSFTNRMARGFLSSPANFVMGEGDREQRTNGHYNGILAVKLTTNLEARVGPGAGYFRSKSWTPVPVDYSLSTTQYQMPVTTAKFLKLEFSNLVPRTYLTDLDELPVRDFPSWVKDWYRSVAPQQQNVPYQRGNPPRELWEGVGGPITTPGDPRKLPRVREALENGGGGLPTITYRTDQASGDALANPELYDQSGLYKELQFATTPLRFMQAGTHEYVTHFVNVERRAFFCGIKELEVYRSDHTVLMDNPEYSEGYDDDIYIADDTNWINVGSSMQAQTDTAVLLSETFTSFSKFNTIQAAVIDCGWESEFTQAQIDFGDVRHLTDPQDADFSVSTSTIRTYVTGQYQGARGGNVIKLERAAAGTGEYGVRTEAGIITGTVITTVGARTSAVVRMQLPQSNNGTYELRLYADDGGGQKLVTSRSIKIPIKSWQEIELAYVANSWDGDWQVEVVQIDESVNEPLVVDMLGIWQNPIKWEFSNDGGATYQTALWPLNNPHGYLRFHTADNELKVRISALREDAVVSGWTVVPWYIESPMVVRAPIDINPPWNISDSEAMRDTAHKPIFRLWNHWFPQRFSVNLYGYH